MRNILYPEWYDENTDRHYPFSDSATLSNGVDVIDDGLFLDIHLYPVGGDARQYLSAIIVAPDLITFTISDNTGELCRGSADPLGLNGVIPLYDEHDRASGVMVLDSGQLSYLGAWPSGAHSFSITQTPFCAAVTHPMPESGVQAFRLEDGSRFTGDVWIVGGEGVVFSEVESGVIRVDVPGDPHYTHRRCEEATGEHSSPERFVKTINGVLPNKFGNIGLVPGSSIVEDNTIRLVPISGGLRFEMVGTRLGALYASD